MPEPDSAGSKPVSTILAFDYGGRRIGVAVGNALIETANPLTTIKNGDDGPDWPAIDTIIGEWQPDLIIVGLPMHIDGSPSENDAQVRDFAENLRSRSRAIIELVDEKLSSVEAKEQIREARQAGLRRRTQSGDIDKFAAQVILRTWLNEQNRAHLPPEP